MPLLGITVPSHVYPSVEVYRLKQLVIAAYSRIVPLPAFGCISRLTPVDGVHWVVLVTPGSVHSA